jgi:hypothetical protein
VNAESGGGPPAPTRGRTPLSWGPEAVGRSYWGQELAESLMAGDTGWAGQTYFL